jgi:hypothetical protein
MEILPFPQTEAYAAAARACGAEAFRVTLGHGTALVLGRAGRAVVLRGPVWPAGLEEGARRADLRRLARRGAVTLVTPEEGVAGAGLIPLVTPVHQAVWDLAGDRRAGLWPAWRRALAQAGGEVRAVPPARRAAALERLVAAEGGLRALRGYRAPPAAFSRALPQGALRLWEWRPGPRGAVGAAAAFVVEGGTATYHLAWSGAEGRQAEAARALLWQAAGALAAEGVRWLDLGAVETQASPGLARFKLGTGAALRRLGPTLWVLPG